MSNTHILVVDDEPDIRNLISDILQDEGYNVATAANGEEANQQLEKQPPQLILLDIWMPDIDGISLMKSWFETNKVKAPIVMMSGHGTVETAVEATRLGAKDFIEKPLSLAKLLQTVSETIEKYQVELDPIVEKAESIQEPLGNSSAILELNESLKFIYNSNSNVLIFGMNGVGKATLVKLIHNKREKPEEKLIHIDFSVATDKNFETQWCDPINGLLVKAQNGHLVLSHIQLMSEAQQAFIKSVLKTRQFQSQMQQLKVDFQVLTLFTGAELSLSSHFDQELLELLSEVKLHVPALKDRSEDIPEILNHFVNTLPDEENTPYRKLSFGVQNKLRNHDWVNNLTELKNTVRHLLLNRAEGDVELEELNEYLQKSSTENTNKDDVNFQSWYQQPLREAREAFEKAYLIHHLKAVDGRVGELAKVAGMERTHLYRKLRALNINPKNIDEES